MASLNRVILIGNLTRDPELRFTPNGAPVANFGIAINRRKRADGSDGGVDFFNIVAWNKTAELCGDYLSKGRPVAIEGRLQSRSYEVEGQKRNVVEVIADNVQFLGSGGGGGRQDGGGQGADSAPNDDDFAAAGIGDDIPF